MNFSVKTDDVIFNFFKQICDEKDDEKGKKTKIASTHVPGRGHRAMYRYENMNVNMNTPKSPRGISLFGLHFEILQTMIKTC